MDKYDFMSMVADIFAQCNNKEEIESQKTQMKLSLIQQAELSKRYLELGILNIN